MKSTFSLLLACQKPKWSGLNVCVPPKSIHWGPTSQCDGIWRWSLWEVIRVRWDHKMDPNNGIHAPLRRDTKELILFLSPAYPTLHTKRTCEDIGKCWPPTSQKESSPKEPNWLAPWSWISWPPGLWENKFLLFKTSRLWCLIWHPEMTKTLIIPKKVTQ